MMRAPLPGRAKKPTPAEMEDEASGFFELMAATRGGMGGA